METNNLIIRESEFNDCKCFAKWETDPAVVEYFSISEDITYEDIVRNFVLAQQEEDKLLYTILLKDENRPIGRIYVSRINREYDSMDITRIYIADPALRNKGYGYEAIGAVLEYAFINLHMERVTLDHFTGNEPASHLYQKLGFEYEGVTRNACKKNGKYYDLHIMSMLRFDYFRKWRK